MTISKDEQPTYLLIPDKKMVFGQPFGLPWADQTELIPSPGVCRPNDEDQSLTPEKEK